MPAKLHLTPEQALERLEREREQTRQRVARWRAKQAVTVTGNGYTEGLSAPAPTYAEVRSTELLVTSSLSEKREDGADFDRIRRLLEPFSGRGYVHDPDFWRCMAAACPDVALEAQVYKMATWLKKPLRKNQKARCSDGFIVNWLEGEQAKAAQRKAAGGAAEPRSVLGRVLKQIATDPVAGPSTWH